MTTDLDAGRVNQKRRTRQDLIDAANRLLADGVTPTLDDVAEAALVSRATAYRYFSSIDELVADAFFARAMASADEVLAGVLEDDLTARVLAVEEHLNSLLMADEVALHTVGRAFMNEWLDDHDSRRPVRRPGRRLPLLDAALSPFADRLGERTLRRLRDALALAIGMEAVFTLRDVLDLGEADAHETARWTLRALVSQAEAEARA